MGVEKMAWPKSNRKDRDAKLLGEIKKLKEYIKEENLRAIPRDFGIAVLTVGGILMTLAISFVPIQQLSHLSEKTLLAGFLLFVSGILFMLSGSGPFKKPRLARNALGKALKKYSVELILMICGICIAILAMVILKV